MPLLAHEGNFSEQLHFRRTYFFTVRTQLVLHSKQLALQTNQFDTTVTFAVWPFLQSCYFFGAATFSDLSFLLSSYFFHNSNLFRAKLLPSSYFLRRGTSLGQLLFRRTNLFKIKIEELLFRSRYFIQCQFFQNSYFFNKVNSSKEVPFQKNHFFRKAIFWNQLILQKSRIFKIFRNLLFQMRYSYIAALPFNSYNSCL